MLKEKLTATGADALREEVVRIVAEISGVSAVEIRDEQNVFNDLAWDSLDAVECAMEIEESFDVSVPEDMLEGEPTVGKIIEGVRRLVDAG
jgi:acyl carrier protein